MIDLASNEFWLTVVFAILAITPLNRPAPRKICLALVNLALPALLLRWQVCLVLAFAAGTWVCLRFAAARRISTLAVGLLWGGTLALFLINKLPLAEPSTTWGLATTWLSVMGFSYIALRVVEISRAVSEQRYPPPDFLDVINYLLPFHMLAAGPIQTYDEYRGQPALPAALGPRGALEALERIAHGLVKKYVLAMVLKDVFLTGFQIPGWYLVWEIQVFYVWLFLDFSAFSDIAAGIGKLLGVATPENFNRPYLARNLIVFWERWHMTLGAFVRRNIFIPLQLRLLRFTDGNFPVWCASLAFLTAFLLCGLWHAIDWRYLSWGGIHAVGLILVNLYRHLLIKRIGSKGVKAYLARPVIHWLMVLLTFEYVAWSLWPIGALTVR